MEGEDPEVVEPLERVLLDALQLVVGDDEGGEAGQVGEHVGGQHGALVVAQVTGR